MVWCLVASIVFLIRFVNTQNITPKVELTAYHPKGLQVIIEHISGNEIVGFHGNVNEDIILSESGSISVNLFNTGRTWTFYKNNVRLKIGDQISYWLEVVNNGLVSKHAVQTFTVKELVNRRFAPHGQPLHSQVMTSFQIPITTQKPTTILNTERLKTCEETILNVTKTLIALQSELSDLRKINQQLISVAETLPNGRKLKLSGRIPLEDSPMTTVKFVLREKLDLNPDIQSATRNPDNSISFEVSSVDEKLRILEAAKIKFAATRIILE